MAMMENCSENMKNRNMDGKLSSKLNFMKIKNNVFTHRQIEKRDGKVFMRLKTRPFITIRYLTQGWSQ